jgi:hypothetical protein
VSLVPSLKSYILISFFFFFFFFLDMGWVLSSPFRVQKIKIGLSIDFLVFLYPLFLLVYN